MIANLCKSAVSALASAALIIAPFPAFSQQSGSGHDQAKATLGGVFWQIDEMRAQLDDAGFDPAALALVLGNDPVAIFNFVQQEIAYQPYPGLLRFGGGTLMNLAGNSCDQAALLGEMLIAAGQDVRFALAPMSGVLQDQLLQTANRPAPAFTAPDAFTLPDAQDRENLFWLGFSDRMIDAQLAEAVIVSNSFVQELEYSYDLTMGLLGPRIDAVLQAPGGVSAPVQQTHCWVRIADPTGWQDLDPTAWWLDMGQSALRPETVVAGLPLTLAPSITLKLELETRGEGGVQTRNILDATSTLFRPVNELTAVFTPTATGDDRIPEPGFARAYVMQLALNGRESKSLPFDLCGRVPPPPPAPPEDKAFGSATSTLSGLFDDDEPTKTQAPPKPLTCGAVARPAAAPAPVPAPSGGGLFGSLNSFLGNSKPAPAKPAPAARPAPPLRQELERLTLEITLKNVAGESRTERRVLLRRPGDLSADAIARDMQRQLSSAYEAVIWGGRIERDYIDAREFDTLLAAQPVYEIMLDARYGIAPETPIETLLAGIETVNVELLEAARISNALVESAAAEFADSSTHVGFPQMMALRTGFVSPVSGGPSRPVRVYDIVSNQLLVSGKDASRRQVEYGITSTLLEYLLAGGGDSLNFYRVLVAARDQGVDMITLRTMDAVSRVEQGIDPDSAALLRADLANGFVAIAPASSVQVGQQQAYGWLRINPVTGETLGRGALGGQAMTERITLESAIAQQKATLPWTLGLCTVFTAFSQEMGGLIASASGVEAPEPTTRSVRQWATEYVACVVISHLSMGAIQGIQAANLARAAAMAAAGGTAMGGARARPAPPVASRPETAPPLRPIPEEPRFSTSRPGAGRNAGRGSGMERPARGRGVPLAEPENRASAGIDRPPHGLDVESGTYIDGDAVPPPRNRPVPVRTAGESFDYLTGQMFGEGAGDRMPIARGRWKSMTSAQRRAALDTYRALRAGDPGGDPALQFQRVMENGRDFTGTRAEQIAQGAIESTLLVSSDRPSTGINLRQLAESAGVTPQQMRQILESRTARLPNTGRRIEVGPDGQVRIRPSEPAFEGLSSRERQLAEISRQDPRNAARDARARAGIDAGRGLSIEEGVAGQAHLEGVPPQEYLNRSGLSRAEGKAALSNYLEKQGLSRRDARAAAGEYLDQPTRVSPPREQPATAPPKNPEGGSAAGRGDRSTPPPPRGARSPIEATESALFETRRLSPEQIRRAVQEAETVIIEPDQISQLAIEGEPISLTPEQLRAIAERSTTLRLTPEQQRQLAQSAETVVLTPEQMRQMAQNAETIRLGAVDLRMMAERQNTVVLTPGQRRFLAENAPTVRLPAERAGGRPPTRAETPTRELRNPGLPSQAEFQTPEAAIRANEPDGLLPAERGQIQVLTRRIAESELEMVPGNQQINQLAERTLMRHQRIAVRSRGVRFRENLDLRQRQGAAREHPIGADFPMADRSQPGINNGINPRRQMVPGDSVYLENIMASSRFEPTQNHVFSETINNNVRTILEQGAFPPDHLGNDRPIRLLQTRDSPPRYIIQDAHHGLIAAEIAARLSGRPLLPSDAAGTGMAPIIPAEHLIIRVAAETSGPPARDARGWGQVGVR